MNKRLVISLIIVAIIVCIVPLLLLPYLYRQYMPQLELYPDTVLLSQTYQPQLAISQCRFSLIHQQKLQTGASREEIWRRLPSQWASSGGVLASYFDQMRFEQEHMQVLRVRSWIHFDSAAVGQTPVFVSNGLVLTLC